MVEAFGEWKNLSRRIDEDREVLQDPELGALARAELPELETRLAAVEQNVRILLLPTGPNDDKNTIPEIHAGTGGQADRCGYPD